METQDGFIVGVHNYCDRWCERCSLTARCRVFAAIARFDFEQDHGPMPASAEEPALRSLGVMALPADGGGDTEAGDGIADDLPEPPSVAPDWTRPTLPSDAQALEDRVKALGFRLATWQPQVGTAGEMAVRDAMEELGHYGIFIGAKVHRALLGLTMSGAPGSESDANGSAKAALLAFDRLRDAWLKLAEHGAVGVASTEPTLTELAWVTREVERRFPQARQFVRPGLDEPTAVAMLDWQERG